MIAGYEPHRIAGLEQHTRAALAGLAEVTSTDAAARTAIAAVTRLRRVLADGFVPAVAGIQATDPLAAATTSSCPLSFDDWIHTRLSDHGDDDLANLLHIELTRQLEENGVPDPNDPRWNSEFAEWVAEFERRARSDPGFAMFLADEAAHNPLIAFIVADGAFDGDLLRAVTGALMDSPSNGTVHDTYRDAAIHALLATISVDPESALAFLGTDGMTERLLTWNDADGGAFGVDGDVVGGLLSAALRHPFDEPARMDEAHDILQQLVDLAHGPLFDRGFPPGTAPRITTGLIGYLPSLVDSLGLDGSVFFESSSGRFETRLGSAAEVVDLFGALMRDASSRALLLTTVPALAVGAESGVYDIEAVNNYVVTLAKAAETEQIEEEIHAARSRADWHTTIGVVSNILETALAVSGKKAAIAGEVVDLVESGAHWLVDRIEAGELGMDDVHTTAFLLLTYGVAVAFLDRRRDDGADDEDRRVAEATRLAEEIDRLLDQNGSPHDVERDIRNLRALVEEIGGDDAMASLDDPRLAPPMYDATDNADLAD